MKTTIELFPLSVKEPKQDERVMVWSERFKEYRPQVFNKACECWDDAEGDDYERDLNPGDIWFSLPQSPDKL